MIGILSTGVMSVIYTGMLDVPELAGWPDDITVGSTLGNPTLVSVSGGQVNALSAGTTLGVPALTAAGVFGLQDITGLTSLGSPGILSAGVFGVSSLTTVTVLEEPSLAGSLTSVLSLTVASVLGNPVLTADGTVHTVYNLNSPTELGQPTPVAGVSAVTWNPADKNSNITLSDGDTLAYNNGTASAWSVRATKYLSDANDDAYFELLIEGAVLHGTGARVGLITSSIDLSSAVSLSTGSVGGVLFTPAGTALWEDGTDLGSVGIGSWNVVDEVLCVAVKMSIGKVFFRLDGGSWTGDPVAGTGGFDIVASSVAPMVGPRRNTGQPDVPGVRLLSLSSDFIQSVPSGFVPYAEA